MITDSIGIDISKDFLDVYRASDKQSVRLENRKAGFTKLKKWVGDEQLARVVYEPTGPYHAAFEQAFRGKLPLVKVNPLHARRFAQAKGARAKTDTIDAKMLAQMGIAFELEPDCLQSEDLPALKELQIARKALITDRTRLKNRLNAQSLAITRRHSKARLRQAEKQLKQIDQEIERLIEECPKRKQASEIIQSIPALGSVTAATILSECPEIGTLTNKAIASLAGLAPMTRQSGKWKGKAFIQGGRKTLRDALYMPALVAAQCNPDLAKQYKRLKQAGKPAKVALTALMRKLLILANTLIKENRKWNEKAT